MAVSCPRTGNAKMIPVLYLLSSVLATFAVLATCALTYLPTRYSFRWLEMAFLSVPLGFTLAAYMSLALAYLHGGLLEQHAIYITCVFALITAAVGPAFLSLVRRESRVIVQELKAAKWLILILAAWVYLFGSLLDTHILRPTTSGSMNVGFGTYGDLPFHLLLIHSFTSGVNSKVDIFNLKSAFYAHHDLVYPYLPDFQSAALMSAGAPLRDSILLPSLPLSVSLIGLLFCLNYRLCRSHSAGLIAVGVSVFSGGMGWVELVWPNWQLTASNIAKVDHIQKTLSNQTVYWWSLIVHILLPQRNSLYAYPLFLAIISLLVAASAIHDRKYVKSRNVLFVLAGFCVAVMPLLQPHSLVAVVVIGLTYCILNVDTVLGNRHVFMGWVAFSVLPLLIGLPQCYLYVSRSLSSDHSRSAQFAAIEPIFSKEHSTSLLQFWWQALGPFLPLSLVAIVLSVRSLGRHWVSWYLGFFAVFALCNVVRFQPWTYDNIKMFYLWVFGVSGGVAMVLDRLRTLPIASIGKRDEHTPGPLASIAPELRVLTTAIFLLVLLAMTATSLLCLTNVLPSDHHFFSAADLSVGKWVRANVPADAVVLGAPDHRNAPIALTGRAAMLGYEGWLWTHGIDYAVRRREALLMWKGAPQALQLFAKNNCKWFFRGPVMETHADFGRKHRATQDQFLAQHATKVYDFGGWEVFNLTTSVNTLQ